MWMRRTDDPAVQHAWSIDIERVLGAAGDLLRAVESLDGRAEDGALLRPGILRVEWRRRRLARGAPSALRRRLLVRLTHATPPSRSRRLRRSARTCRSGRCCRRARDESVQGWDSRVSRATRRSP